MNVRCPLCRFEIAENVCPKCGEDLRKWRELDDCAEQLLLEGTRLALGDNAFAATTCFLKAIVLRPKDVRILKALGMNLAQQGNYPDARYYLERCMRVAEAEALPPDPTLPLALAKIQSLTADPASVPMEAAADAAPASAPVAVSSPAAVIPEQLPAASA